MLMWRLARLSVVMAQKRCLGCLAFRRFTCAWVTSIPVVKKAHIIFEEVILISDSGSLWTAPCVMSTLSEMVRSLRRNGELPSTTTQDKSSRDLFVLQKYLIVTSIYQVFINLQKQHFVWWDRPAWPISYCTCRGCCSIGVVSTASSPSQSDNRASAQMNGGNWPGSQWHLLSQVAVRQVTAFRVDNVTCRVTTCRRHRQLIPNTTPSSAATPVLLFCQSTLSELGGPQRCCLCDGWRCNSSPGRSRLPVVGAAIVNWKGFYDLVKPEINKAKIFKALEAQHRSDH